MGSGACRGTSFASSSPTLLVGETLLGYTRTSSFHSRAFRYSTSAKNLLRSAERVLATFPFSRCVASFGRLSITKISSMDMEQPRTARSRSEVKAGEGLGAAVRDAPGRLVTVYR